MIKRLIKILISLSVFFLDKVLKNNHKWGCVVIYLHSTPSRDRKKFERIIKNIKKYTIPISINTNISFLFRERYSLITFDDGYTDILSYAIPDLKRNGIPCVIFIPTNFIGKYPTYVKEEKYRIDCKILSESQIKEIVKDELVVIGSHGISHTAFSYINDADVLFELQESKKTLESIIGKDVKYFSFPHGKYNKKHLQIAREVGYAKVFTITPKLAVDYNNQFCIGRINIETSDWPIEVKLKILGCYRWMAYVRKNKSSL